MIESISLSNNQWLKPSGDRFRLDLQGHEPLRGTTAKGHVVAEHEGVGAEDLEGLSVRDIYVSDPYLESDYYGYRIVKSYVDGIEDVLKEDGFTLENREDRTEAKSPVEYNAYTKTWLNDPRLEALAVWRSLVPTAPALAYLLNQTPGTKIVNPRLGSEAVITNETAMILRFGDDAIGIRDRAVAMEHIATRFLRQHDTQLNEDYESPLKKQWLSLASGTAEPSIAAAKSAESAGIPVDLHVADIDKLALEYVNGVAEQYRFRGGVETKVMNILRRSRLRSLLEKPETSEGYDVVEAMGFLEYVPQPGDKYRNLVESDEGDESDSQDRIKTASEFLAEVYDNLNARSEHQLQDLLSQAGLVDRVGTTIELYRVMNATADVHIYDIIKINKAKH
jgi:hypothetical protein